MFDPGPTSTDSGLALSHFFLRFLQVRQPVRVQPLRAMVPLMLIIVAG